MNSIVFVFAAVFAVAHGGYLGYSGDVHSVYGHGARTTHLEGPSASAHVVGNDGSHIVGVAPGAHITATEHVGGAAVAYSAPAVHAYSAHHGAYAAPAVYGHHGAYAAPAVYGHHDAYAYGAHHAYPYFARGSGIEGQYVHDYTESLYDDGSYKGEYYH